MAPSAARTSSSTVVTSRRSISVDASARSCARLAASPWWPTSHGRRRCASYLRPSRPGGRLALTMFVPGADDITGFAWRLRRTGTDDDGISYVVHEATGDDVESQVHLVYNRSRPMTGRRVRRHRPAQGSPAMVVPGPVRRSARRRRVRRHRGGWRQQRLGHARSAAVILSDVSEGGNTPRHSEPAGSIESPADHERGSSSPGHRGARRQSRKRLWHEFSVTHHKGPADDHVGKPRRRARGGGVRRLVGRTHLVEDDEIGVRAGWSATLAAHCRHRALEHFCGEQGRTRRTASVSGLPLLPPQPQGAPERARRCTGG